MAKIGEASHSESVSIRVADRHIETTVTDLAIAYRSFFSVESGHLPDRQADALGGKNL